MTKKYMICSDIHDDIEALAAFLDYSQAQEADAIFVLGDMQLRPFTKEALDKLMQEQDADAFIKAKQKHSRKVYRVCLSLSMTNRDHRTFQIPVSSSTLFLSFNGVSDRNISNPE